MDAFKAIGVVTGGATLAAFIVAVLATVWKSTIAKDTQVLESITGDAQQIKARESVAQSILEKFHIDTTGMSSQDKTKLALAQLVERRKRLTLMLGSALAFGVIGAVVSIVALLHSGTTPEASTLHTDIHQTVGDHGVIVSGSGNTVINQ